MRNLALVISAMLLCLTNSVVAQLLPAPALTGPANGATAVTTTPTFSWTPVAGANRYWLVVATSAWALPSDPFASSCPVCVTTGLSGNTGSTSFTPPNAFPFGGTTRTLSPGTTYYWKVQGYSTSGAQGAYSEMRSFTTASTPQPPSGPGAFTLSLGTPYCDTRPPPGPAVRLDWSTASGSGVTYTVFRNGVPIQTSSLPTSGLSFVNETGLVAGQTYTYQVRASNSGGTRDSNSVSVFMPADVCGPTPPPPLQDKPNLRPSSVLITPSSGAPGSTALVGFNVANTGNAASRRCQINIRITQPNVIPTTSDLMLVPTFTIEAIPAGGFTTVTKSVEIPTGLSEGDRSVWVIVDVDRAAGQAAADEVDDRANTPFRVGSTVTAGPNLVPSNFSVTPSSGAAGARPLVNFGVTNSGSVASSPCTAQIRLSSSPTTPADSDPVVGTFSVPSIAAGGGNGIVDRIDIPTNASAGPRFLWLRIDANNAAGQAQADRANDLTLASFTITGGPPVPPPPPPTQGAPGAFTLLSPTSGRTNVAHAPLLDWSDAAGAEHYIVTIDDSADFRSPLPSIRVAASESQYQFPNAALSRGKRYTWKVDAVSAGGMTRATPATSSFVVTSSAAPPPPPPTAETVPLQNGVVFQIGNMAKSQKRHFRVSVPPGAVGLSVTTAGAAAGDVDIYLQRGQPADMGRGQFTSSSAVKGSNEVVIVGDGLTSGDYFVMVYAKKASNGVSIVADFSDDPAARTGTVLKPDFAPIGAFLQDTTRVALRRVDGAERDTPILRNAKTWLVIHGRESKPGLNQPASNSACENNIGRLAKALSALPRKDNGAQQVLVLDWEEGANDNNLTLPLLPTFGGSYWIPSVARWAGQQLDDLGIEGENLHILGHSWGAYVAYETSDAMATNPLSSSPHAGSIIAIDPAEREGSDALGITIGTRYPNAAYVNFDVRTYRSASFLTSEIGDEPIAKTARWAVDTRIDAPGDDRSWLDQHGNGVEMLAGIVERLATKDDRDESSLDKLFDPSHLLIAASGKKPAGWKFLGETAAFDVYNALLCARFVSDATGDHDERGADQWVPETLYTLERRGLCESTSSACAIRAGSKGYDMSNCLIDDEANASRPPSPGDVQRHRTRISIRGNGEARPGLVDARFNAAVYLFKAEAGTQKVRLAASIDGVGRDDLFIALLDGARGSYVDAEGSALTGLPEATNPRTKVFEVTPGRTYYPVVYTTARAATRFQLRIERAN